MIESTIYGYNNYYWHERSYDLIDKEYHNNWNTITNITITESVPIRKRSDLSYYLKVVKRIRRSRSSETVQFFICK